MATDLLSLLQLVQIVGVSGAFAAGVSFFLEGWRFSKRRAIEREEERLLWSVENFPKFSTYLNNLVNALREARDLRPTQEQNRKKEFNDALMNVVCCLGKLCIIEQEFRDKQGQLFRLGNQGAEILARFLYALGKEDLGLSSSRLGKRNQFSLRQENYLMKAITVDEIREKTCKTLEEFIETTENDPIIREICQKLGKLVKKPRGAEWAEKNLDVLSRLLIDETQKIKLPGYQREPVRRSLPDSQYINALRRTASIFISRSSLNDKNFENPLRIWVYNHWNHDITFKPTETQIRVCNHASEGCKPVDAVSELTLLSPKIIENKDLTSKKIREEALKHKKLELKSGETAVALWDRTNWKSGKYAGDGTYQIIYLPDSEDISHGTTSAYATDYEMRKEEGYQSWRLRSTFV